MKDEYSDFIRAVVQHCVDRFGADEVGQWYWEVWNEPHHQSITVESYAAFLIRTAESVRSKQPGAQILAMSNAGVGRDFTDKVLAVLEAQGRVQLVNEVTYHPYSKNPDSVYGSVLGMRADVALRAGHISLRQGENGCPSQRSTKALGRYDWSELTQAKWALRRLLGDLGRDIPSSYFSIIDMHYAEDGINRPAVAYQADPIVVDNTGPVIRKYNIDKSGRAATLKLQITDELSAIGKLEYTIDSNAKWKSTLPDDLVFDTTDESFTILTEELEPGEHVLALKISDNDSDADVDQKIKCFKDNQYDRVGLLLKGDLFALKATEYIGETVDKVYNFIQNRVSRMLEEEGFAKDVLQAHVGHSPRA